MFGSDTLAKDCLEYVVFERHLADEYGLWRIHGKITPPWLPPAQPVLRTMRKPKFEETTPPAGDGEVSKEADGKSTSSNRPQLAAA